MENKTSLITGANSGIGKQAAIQLAKAGFRVFVGARKRERGLKSLKYSVNIQLFDLVGNKLMEKSAESDVEQIDLKNFSLGVYFLHITKNMKKKTIKIIKQ